MALTLVPNVLNRIKQTRIFEKKILAQSLYSKFFILNKINGTCFIIENNFKVFHLLKKNCKQFIKSSAGRSKKTSKDFAGYSFLGTPKVFRDKYSKSLEFEHFLPRSHTYQSVVGVDNYVSSLERSFKKGRTPLQEYEKYSATNGTDILAAVGQHFSTCKLSLLLPLIKKSGGCSANKLRLDNTKSQVTSVCQPIVKKRLFLTRSLKGGFKCRFNGLGGGFLPLKQFRYGMSKWLKTALTIVHKRGPQFLLIFWPSLLNYKTTLNRLLFFRLPYLRVVPKLNARYRTVLDYSNSKSKRFFFGNASKKRYFSPTAGTLIDARSARPTVRFILLCNSLLLQKKQKQKQTLKSVKS
jgi:hypothetical protein